MDSLLGAVTLASIGIQALLLLYVQVRRQRLRTGYPWLLSTLLLSLLAALTFLLPPDVQITGKYGRNFALTLALAALVIAFGAVVVSDTQRQPATGGRRAWLLLGLLWLGGLIAAGLLSPTISIAEGEWLVAAVNAREPFSLMALGGLGVVGAVLLGICLYAFYIAPLPEIANRALFWIINTAVIVVGVILMLSGSQTLTLLGVITLLVGVAGAVYAQLSYRVFDIRNGVNLSLRTALVVTMTALLLFGALQAVSRLPVRSGMEANVLLALLALAVALLYVPVRQLADAVFRPIIQRGQVNPTIATRRYSQRVSGAVELDQLIRVATETLNESLRVRRSGLILVNDTGGENGQIELMVMPGGGFADFKNIRGYVAKAGPVYRQLAVKQSPLTQFDLEFSPDYKTLAEPERQFFNSLRMSAYAPVIVENSLIGILACGPKINDAPFYPRDLEVLATMANQTGVGLRNARLVADLRHLNRSMEALNKGLEEANQQMEKLDSVKTEFVTIASHELRTPLAQIRGYTDIMDQLNSAGMLNQDQIGSMVGNLRKASERMEELITAMLDVSQLDVNAMDLRFSQTTPEAIIRMAIEPLTDAIKQRKLTLSARGLRGLPTIEADMQRLVQAFRNIVVNAIKFTPDGGRIEINASLQPAEKPGEKDHILIAITDTGVGIARENLELIFQKFYRAYDPGLHSTGTYKFMGAGPGLGLTIAKGVIEGHGGKIWAESPGHNMESCPGSTFFVELPLVPPANARRVLPMEGEK
ncbi:MAG: GAF domain-containing sensor histidine kinase [Chloroflexi bacterium]|nr:GAF domain-containing sensor histidine kinase [Chloroflexota bacterium]